MIPILIENDTTEKYEALLSLATNNTRIKFYLEINKCFYRSNGWGEYEIESYKKSELTRMYLTFTQNVITTMFTPINK